jgi:hypothetical protein
MIKINNMKRKAIILIILLSLIYINTDYFIKKYIWKNVSRHQITLIMFFDNKDMKLSNHKIYSTDDNQKMGIVLLSLYKILITLNSKGEICYYINHGKPNIKEEKINKVKQIIMTKDTIIVRCE